MLSSFLVHKISVFSVYSVHFDDMRQPSRLC